MKTWQKIKQNPALLPQYLVREQVLDGIREYFKQQRFHEVETPSMVERPSTETYLEFFDTQLDTAEGQHKKAFLITSPEYAMKKLLVAGVGNCFQICKSFRNNEGLSHRHNPEFTILEWYRTEADYKDVMKDCEGLLLYLLHKVQIFRQLPTSNNVSFQGKVFDLSAPWVRLSVAEAFEKFAQINTDELLDEQALIIKATKKGYQVTHLTTWEEVYNQIFLNEVEPRLADYTQPVILYDYPASQAALSKRKVSDPRFAERFEFYINGLELGNAFSELADAEEQAARLRADLKYRQSIGRKNYELDEDFIEALRTGLPRTGGIAVGVDRLVMLLADVPSIHDTMFFPVHDVFEI